ncbi:MAG TPA: M23 family metallopeptidase [Acidimicrobiales bacterium]|nr:M23 family metallopeptidase [Acidimicrobiales bacterium]
MLLPTLLVLLGAALIASADGGHGQSSYLDIDGEMLLSSQGDFGMVRPRIDRFPGETTTTTAAPPTTTTTAPSPTTAPPTTAPPTTTPPAPPPAPAGAEMVCPVQGPVSFVDSFGAPRSGGRAHQGVDMMAAMGTPTVAPVSGRVEHRGNATGGLSWWLYGDNGDEYYGTHLSAYANEGVGWVGAGTVIGYVGDSGNAAGTPHLHFEIHPGGGGAINPFPDTAAAC